MADSVLITGASTGLGLETAVHLAEQGFKVYGTMRNLERRDALDAEAARRNVSVEVLQLDVTDKASIDRAVSAIIAESGEIYGLVNNAGIALRKRIEDTTEEEWDRIMAINAKGVFLGIKQAIPAMRQSGGGSIINISSTAGLVGSPYSGASYAATKGAVRLLTKATAIQYAKEGIRCNSVHPGLLETPMTEDMLADAAHREERTARIPLGRIGTAEDIAYGVLYLASDEASFITGSELVIDGGATAQ